MYSICDISRCMIACLVRAKLDAAGRGKVGSISCWQTPLQHAAASISPLSMHTCMEKLIGNFQAVVVDEAGTHATEVVTYL